MAFVRGRRQCSPGQALAEDAAASLVAQRLVEVPSRLFSPEIDRAAASPLCTSFELAEQLGAQAAAAERRLYGEGLKFQCSSRLPVAECRAEYSSPRVDGDKHEFLITAEVSDQTIQAVVLDGADRRLKEWRNAGKGPFELGHVLDTSDLQVWIDSHTCTVAPAAVPERLFMDRGFRLPREVMRWCVQWYRVRRDNATSSNHPVCGQLTSRVMRGGNISVSLTGGSDA